MQEPTFSVSTFTSSPSSPSPSSSSATNATTSTTPISDDPPHANTSSASPATPTPDDSNPVTCAAVSSKFVVLGLTDGSVALYDVFGNLLDHHARVHVAPVTTVTLGGGPASDSVVASAAANGDIRVARLSETRQAMLSSATVAFTKPVSNAPVLALAVDPLFGRPRYGQRVAFADGNGNVIIHTSGWFWSDLVIYPSSTTTTITKNSSSQLHYPILSLVWVHHLLAFPSVDGVHVYDTKHSRLVCRIAAPGVSQPTSPAHDHPTPPPLERTLPSISEDNFVVSPSSIGDKNSGTSHVHSNNTRRDSISSSYSIHSNSNSIDPSNRLSQSSSQRRPSSWALQTRVHMEIDDSVPPSAQGEPAVRLYLTWPEGARIVRVSAQATTVSGQTVPSHAREIDVVFKLERHSLVVPYSSSEHDHDPRTTSANISSTDPPLSVDDSPLLSVVPFGTDECVALVGLPSGRICLHLVSPEGRSLKHMILPPQTRTFRDANLLTVPGGDPLVLVIAHPLVNDDDDDDDDDDDTNIGESDKASQLESEQQHRTYATFSTASFTPGRSKKSTESKKANGNSNNVAAPADVLYVRSLTTAERVKWLLGEDRFLDALSVAQSAPGGSLRRAEVSLVDIGEQFLESLKDAGDFERLATVLPETISTTSPFAGFRSREKVLMKRRRRWERWIEVFKHANHLSTVSPVIPTYEPLLPQEAYTGILCDLSSTDPNVMVSILKTWPADVFDVSTVTKGIEEQLATPGLTTSTATESKAGTTAEAGVRKKKDHLKWKGRDRDALNEGLLMLYALSGRHDETLLFLLRDKSPKVYDYIRSHHLYEAVRSADTITGLYEIDPSAATDVLARAPETVLPPDAVVPLLNKVDNSLWTYMYLHAVFRMDVDHAPKYHNTLLRLYVKHGPPGSLYNFLRTSTHYSLDVALEVMGGPKGKPNGSLARERVYTLSAMGDLNSAMDILLDELGDTFAAIEFATDNGDHVLWERLIEHAKTHADTLAALLDSPAGGKVDPVRLVPLLKSEMRIPNLRDRLHRILVDAALERALREDAAAALHHDVGQLLNKLDDTVAGLQL